MPGVASDCSAHHSAHWLTYLGNGLLGPDLLEIKKVRIAGEVMIF